MSDQGLGLTYDEVREILEEFASQCYQESGSYSGCAGAFQSYLTLLIIGDITPARALDIIKNRIKEPA